MANEIETQTQTQTVPAVADAKPAVKAKAEPEAPSVQQLQVQVQVLLDLTSPKFTSFLETAAMVKGGDSIVNDLRKTLGNVQCLTASQVPVVYNFANPMAKRKKGVEDGAFGPLREAIGKIAAIAAHVNGTAPKYMCNKAQLGSVLKGFASNIEKGINEIFLHSQDAVVCELELFDEKATQFKFSDFIKIGSYVLTDEEFGVVTNTVVTTFKINAFSLYVHENPSKFVLEVLNRLKAIVEKDNLEVSVEVGVLLSALQLNNTDTFNMVGELLGEGFSILGEKDVEKSVTLFDETSSILVFRDVMEEPEEEDDEESTDDGEE
jgi:hypothetical protein